MKEKRTKIPFFSFLSILLALCISHAVKAGDVTVNATQTFTSLDASDGSADGVFNINGNLFITATGNITGPGGASGIKIVIINGGLTMDVGGKITGDAVNPNAGIPIDINAKGNILLHGNGTTGAKITSNESGGSCSGGKGGNIKISSDGDIITKAGSVISSNAICSAGDILIQALAGKVTIGGLVESRSFLTGTGATQRPGGGPITILAKCSLTVDKTGKVNSQGSDPGADLVHLEACAVNINGLVQSTGAGHVAPNTPVTDLVPPNRPDKPANSTAGVEVWADAIIIDKLNNNGEVNADLSVGASCRSWIDLYATNDITILGKASGNFAVHANNAGNNPTGGLINVKSVKGKVSAGGLAIQANAPVGGGDGGSITVHAKKDADLSGGKLEARGGTSGTGPHGGSIAVRSFGTNPNTGAIVATAASNLNVTGGVPADGTVNLSACGTIGFPPGTVTPATIVAGLTPACGDNPLLPAYAILPIENCSQSAFCSKIIECPCITCNENVIVVDQNVTINFATTPPTYSGDADLKPFFSYDKTGATADLWKAIFDLGLNKLQIKNGATITTAKVNGFAPGIQIKGTCTLEIETGGKVTVISNNKNAGDILIQMNGDIIVNGEIRNEVTGTVGLPGCITTVTKCGNFTVGQKGLIQDLGIDAGACGVTIMACGKECENGDITINGLVKGFAHAHAGDLTLNRPDIHVYAFNGAITVNANTAEPLYDEFSMGGGAYDIYGGLLSWVRDNVNPGTVEVQAKNDITVNGHGTDPTGTVRRSFGAIAAVATASSSPGGIVDVRSLEGNIIGNDRAFDVSGRNGLATLFAHINLAAKLNISLNRLGANDNFNPVVDASSPFTSGRGGLNDLCSYTGNITIGALAKVSAAVAGGGGTPGVNNLTSCLGVNNSGTVTPADANAGDDAGVCAPDAPIALKLNCEVVAGGAFRKAQGDITHAVSAQGSEFYPNPAHGSGTIRFNAAQAAHYTISLTDMTGRTVLTYRIAATAGWNVQELSLDGIAKGIYSLQLENDSAKEQIRITVQ